MKCLVRIFLVLSVSISIFLLSSCMDPAETALETPEYSSNKYGDDMEEYEEDLEEGLDAVNEISDDSVLIKIINEAANPVIRRAAVEKIPDQAVLKHLVSDVLLRICFNNADGFLREAAVKKLCYEQMISKLNSEKESKEAQTMYKVIRAFDNIPKEHRFHLMSEILPAVSLLSYKEIENEFGEILLIEPSWDYRSASYVGQHLGPISTLRGERVSFWIKLGNLQEPLSSAWTTDFPENVYSVDTVLSRASIKLSDMLYPILDRLPDITLAKIVKEGMDWQICQYCAGKIKDQNLLVRAAIESNIWQIWNILDTISQQSILKKIALDAHNSSIRCLVIRRITDQPFLAKIAIEEKDLDVGKAAVEAITDMRLLKKVADESKDEAVSESALYKYEINSLYKTTP